MHYKSPLIFHNGIIQPPPKSGQSANRADASAVGLLDEQLISPTSVANLKLSYL